MRELTDNRVELQQDQQDQQMSEVQNKEIICDESVKEFLAFIQKKEQFLESGLGAFHTNGHSNW